MLGEILPDGIERGTIMLAVGAAGIRHPDDEIAVGRNRHEFFELLLLTLHPGAVDDQSRRDTLALQLVGTIRRRRGQCVDGRLHLIGQRVDEARLARIDLAGHQ